MTMTNRWNQFIYRLWSPVYDAALGRFFLLGRKLSLEMLNLRPGEKVLLVGVGTGADLPLLPDGVEATGIDLSPEMLARAKSKLPVCHAAVELIQGDAEILPVADNFFDAAILNLILSVVPDGRVCLQSTLKALRPGGRIVIFDKFQPEDRKPSLLRKTINLFSSLFGTDITRSYGQIAQNCACVVEQDVPSLLNGMYRVMIVRKV